MKNKVRSDKEYKNENCAVMQTCPPMVVMSIFDLCFINVIILSRATKGKKQSPTEGK